MQQLTKRSWWCDYFYDDIFKEPMVTSYYDHVLGHAYKNDNNLSMLHYYVNGKASAYTFPSVIRVDFEPYTTNVIKYYEAFYYNGNDIEHIAAEVRNILNTKIITYDLKDDFESLMIMKMFEKNIKPIDHKADF